MARHEITGKDVRWIHITKPTIDDFSFVRSLHSFDEIVLDYISSPTLHPSLEEFGDNIYFILHFPIIYPTEEHNKAIEIDFLMTKDTLITITYEPYSKLEELFKQTSQDEQLHKKYMRSHSGYVLYLILENMYQSMIKDHDYIQKAIDELEADIFSSTSEKMAEDISYLTRDILDFRRVFSTQGSVLELLPKALTRMLGKTSIPKFTNIIVTQDRIQRLIDNHKETIDSLQATYSALVENKISRIVKVLTIFSAIILPISLIAGIWGMNHRFLPLRDGALDFWIVIGLMISIVVVMLFAFKRSKWI